MHLNKYLITSNNIILLHAYMPVICTIEHFKIYGVYKWKMALCFGQGLEACNQKKSIRIFLKMEPGRHPGIEVLSLRIYDIATGIVALTYWAWTCTVQLLVVHSKMWLIVVLLKMILFFFIPGWFKHFCTMCSYEQSC